MKQDAKPPKPRPPEKVLVKVCPDGYFTIHGENITVEIVYISHAPGNEILAEDTAELLTKAPYRRLFSDGYVKATGIVREIRPSTFHQARRMQVAVDALNALKGGK